MSSSVANTSHPFLRFSGVIGAALFLIGDLLVFGHFGPGAGFREGAIRVAQEASPTQLYAGGLLGPVGAVFLLVGIGSLNSCLLAPRSTTDKAITFFLAAFVVSAGSVHSLWSTNALLIKFCFGQGPACADALQSVQAYWQVTFLLSAALGLLSFGLFAWRVASKRTSLPRWTAITSPLLILVIAPLGRALPSPVGAVDTAGSASLCLLVFFLAAALSAETAA